jgi:hypothetical protein
LRVLLTKSPERGGEGMVFDMCEAKISYSQYYKCKRSAEKEVAKDITSWLYKGYIRMDIVDFYDIQFDISGDEADRAEFITLTFKVIPLRRYNQGDSGFMLEWCE